MQHYSQILVWQRAHALCVRLYKVTDVFPDRERFGLTAQLRSAAMSVPSNIAEGAKKVSRIDYAKFLNTAEGSIAETEYLVVLARDLGYLTRDDASELIEEAAQISRMLFAFRKTVQRTERHASKTATFPDDRWSPPIKGR